jgi:hypothetical protein
MLKSLSALTAATVLGLAAVSISATGSDAKNNSSRFRCDAVGTGDTSFSVQYEERVKKKGPRNKFRAEFEASTADGFVAGTPVVFSVNTVAVGTVPLGSVGPADLEAELRLDSKAHGRGHKKPFPPGFPVVVAGSVVDASIGAVVLGCVLALN